MDLTKVKEQKRKGGSREVVTETKDIEDTEEELRRIAAIAAVVAMTEGEQKEKEKVRMKRKVRYPSPWVLVNIF